MGRIINIKCEQCKEDKAVWASANNPHPIICNNCVRANEIKAQAEYFDMLDKLTIHQRIRRIEEWIYNYKPPVPLSEMRF